MSRLTKGMFDGANLETFLFGLCSGVCKNNAFAYNASWFNADGEELGWGDLSLDDLRRIADGLEEGELFIILLERDSLWRAQQMRKDGSRNPDPRVWIAEFTPLVIGPETIYAVIPEGNLITTWSLSVLDPLVKLAMLGGIKISVIPRKEARKILLGHDGSRLGRLIYKLTTRWGKG